MRMSLFHTDILALVRMQNEELEKLQPIINKLERELIGVKAVVETFIRCVHADGDSDMDWGKLPTLLDAIEDYVDEGREALAVVAKLPKCNWLKVKGDERELVQDVPVVPGMVVWWAIKGSLWQGGVLGMFGNYLLALAEDGLKWSKQSTLLYSDCYNSEAAAKFARENTTND